MHPLKGFLLILFLNFYQTESTHFRGGSLSISPFDAAPKKNNVSIKLFTYFAWRRNYDNTTHCDEKIINDQTHFAPNLNILCDRGCDHSPNEIIANTSIICTSYSDTDNWSLGQNSFAYTLSLNRSIEISFKGNFWIELAHLDTNRHNAYWELRAKYSTFIRNDTNRLNTSPITLIPPIFRLEKGKEHLIRIPTVDLDDDLVKCRWSQADHNECASICQSLKNRAELDSDECNLRFNATNATLGWYAVAIQIEDFNKFNNSLSMSSVPIQFLIVVEDKPITVCSQPPRIVQPQSNECVQAQEGQPIHKQIIVESLCSDLKEIQVLGPMGAFKTNSYKLSNENKKFNSSVVSSFWYSNLSWTPKQKGAYLICITAIDMNRIKSNLSCFSILVDILKPNMIRANPIGLTDISNEKEIKEFMIQFDSFSIRKQSNLSMAFIRLYEEETNVQVSRVDAAQIQIKMNEIWFHFSNILFRLNKWYYILLDAGVVMGGHEEECRSDSAEMNNSTKWRFKFTSRSNNTATVLIKKPSNAIIHNCDSNSFKTILYTLPLLSLVFY